MYLKELIFILALVAVLSNARSVQNPYYILRLNPSANKDAIKKAHRALALEFHPDKVDSDIMSQEEASERFIEIQEAYEKLLDISPEQQKTYEQEYWSMFCKKDELHKKSLSLKDAIVLRSISKAKAVLAQHPQQLNVRDKQGAMPLHNALILKDIRMIKLLLDAGADVNTRVEEYAPSLANSSPLFLAILGGQPQIVELLLKADADVEARVDGKTPLHWAINKNNPKMVELLLKAGADVNAESMTKMPLHWAILGGQPEIVELLLKTGADVDVRLGLDGGTPLQWTILYTGNPKMVELLLKAGADVEALVDGKTPLQWARLANNLEIEQLLLDAGAADTLKSSRP